MLEGAGASSVDWDMMDGDKVDWHAVTMLHRLRPWELARTQSSTKATDAKMGHKLNVNVYVPIVSQPNISIAT